MLFLVTQTLRNEAVLIIGTYNVQQAWKLHVGHGLGAPSKVSHRLQDFPNGNALCKMKKALPSKR